MFSFLASILMHVFLVWVLSFSYSSYDPWRDYVKNSIPVSITKLSDITSGPVIGHKGLIDDSLPITDEDSKQILPPNTQKEQTDIPLSAASQTEPNVLGGDSDIDEKGIDTRVQAENSAKKDIGDVSLKENKKIEEDRLESKKDAFEPDLDKGTKQNLDNMISDILQQDNIKKKKIKKKTEDAEVKSFLNNILGDKKGKGANKSGGAQYQGELSASAITALIEMIKPCWIIMNIPGAAKMHVRVQVTMTKEGYVANAKVLNPKWSDPVFKTVANSATRALADRRCQPFKLPSKDYKFWNRMILNFCPSDLSSD